MKRDQLILIGCGVPLVAVCLGAGWFLFSAISERRSAAEQRNQAYEDLQGLYNAKVFPSEENIARIREDQKALETWLVAASNVLHTGDLQAANLSPTAFKALLQSTVRDLSSHAGSVQGKIVAPGFNFGFDAYLGQDSLPKQEDVDRLTVQLDMIRMICKELFAANIMELKGVSREIFDVAGPDADREQEESSSRRNRKSRRDRTDKAETSKKAAGGDSAYYAKQRFSFEFVARPTAFIDALNRLAAMPQFVVVSDVEFHKTADPLAQRAAQKADRSSGGSNSAVSVDPATLTHMQRIVTDPELEPPVSVKLDVDVYSFEGV